MCCSIQLICLFDMILECQKIFSILFLKKPPKEGLSEVLGHLDTDSLPGLIGGALGEASLLHHGHEELVQVQGFLVHGWTLRHRRALTGHEVHVAHQPGQSLRAGVHVKQDLEVKALGLLELLFISGNVVSIVRSWKRLEHLGHGSWRIGGWQGSKVRRQEWIVGPG